MSFRGWGSVVLARDGVEVLCAHALKLGVFAAVLRALLRCEEEQVICCVAVCGAQRSGGYGRELRYWAKIARALDGDGVAGVVNGDR